MKGLIKLVGVFLLGIAVGCVGIWLVIWLFSDKSMAEIMEKAQSRDILTILRDMVVNLVLIFITLYMQILLHEGGHWLFGRLSGYRLVSFRILQFTIIREGTKLRIKCFDIAGTGGQCLLSPPDRPAEDVPVFWYNAGGVLMNLMTGAVAFALWMQYGGNLWLFLALFGLFFALANGIPMKISGIGNDGYNQLLLRRNPQSRVALIMGLRINAHIQAGSRPKELPAAWFMDKEPTDYTDTLQVGYWFMTLSRLQDNREWDAAYTLLTRALAHRQEIIGIYVKEMDAELLYTALILGRIEEATRICTDELKQYLQQYSKYSSAKQRQLAGIALYIEKDRNKARSIYEEVLAKQPEYLMQGEVRMDIALIHDMLPTGA